MDSAQSRALALVRQTLGSATRHYEWLLILLLAAWTRCYRLDAPALWYDEAFSLVMSTDSVSGLLTIAARDVHPPLYYLCLKAWINLAGTSVIALRSLSVLAGVVTVGLGMWLAALTANRRAAAIAGIVMALLPLAVRYSQEVRMYTLVCVWMTAATIALVYWVQQPQRYRYLVAYAVLIVAGLYTHYFSFLGIAAHWGYLAMPGGALRQGARRLVMLPGWWIAHGASLLAFLPWIPSLNEQLGNIRYVGWIMPLSLDSLPTFFWQFLLLDSGSRLPAIFHWGLVLAVFWLCAYCIASDRTPLRFSVLLTLYSCGALVLTLIVSLWTPFLVARYLMFSMLGLAVLLGVALDRLIADHCRVAVLIFVLVTGLEATGLSTLYGSQQLDTQSVTNPNERIDVIAGYIDKNFRTGDQVIALNFMSYPSLAYYTHTSTPLLYTSQNDEDDECVQRIYCRFIVLYSPARNNFYISRLEGLAPKIHRVWIVDAAIDVDHLSFPCHWQLVETWVTGLNRLRLYEINAGQPMSTAKPCPAS